VFSPSLVGKTKRAKELYVHNGVGGQPASRRRRIGVSTRLQSIAGYLRRSVVVVVYRRRATVRREQWAAVCAAVRSDGSKNWPCRRRPSPRVFVVFRRRLYYCDFNVSTSSRRVVE
jgi:hypothetical protein